MTQTWFIRCSSN